MVRPCFQFYANVLVNVRTYFPMERVFYCSVGKLCAMRVISFMKRSLNINEQVGAKLSLKKLSFIWRLQRYKHIRHFALNRRWEFSNKTVIFPFSMDYRSVSSLELFSITYGKYSFEKSNTRVYFCFLIQNYDQSTVICLRHSILHLAKKHA